MKSAIQKYLAAIGRKGGQAKGKRKARGDSAYYAELARKRKKSPKGE